MADEMYTRVAELGRADGESRTAPLTLSTETPVNRGDYLEVLDHRPGAVDLSRAPLPLILGHDPRALPIGVVEKLTVSNGRLRGIARFSKSPEAQQVFDDVQDGIVRGVSIGYEYTGKPERINDTTLRFKFKPLEVSALAVPADANAGFYRSKENAMPNLTRSQRRAIVREDRALQFATVPADDRREFTAHIESLEEESGPIDGNVADEYRAYRQDAIRTIAGMWPDRPEISAIAETIAGDQDFTVAAFRSKVLKMINDSKAPPIKTGKLDATDEARYGSGAREIVHSGPLKHFHGADAVQRAYSVGMWLKGAAGDRQAATWCQECGIVAQRVMTEGIFTAGGAAVPDMVASEILSNVEQYGTFRQFARNWPMSSASLSVPTNNEGLTMGAVGENTATTTSDLTMGAVTLMAKEFAGGVRISRSLLEDSAANLADFMTGELARILAKTEDSCGWIGDSTSTYGGMAGMFHRIKNVATCAGSKITAPTAGHDTFAEIDATDLTTLMAALPEYARAGSAWYCSGTARDLVFSRLVATAGGNNVQTLSGKPGENYLGYPIRVSQVLPAGAATDYSGECMLAFGNLSMAAAFGDRRQLQVEFDLSRYIEFRQAYLQITSRFDIVNHLQGVSATVPGPLVALVGGAS